MRRWLPIILLILCAVVLGVGGWFIYTSQDRIGPDIILPAEQLTYYEGNDTATLLEGATALDKKDGDVSDTLRVGEILVAPGASEATVVYIAKDRSNNVTKLTRRVYYVPEGGTPPAEAAGSAEAETEAETNTTSAAAGTKASTEAVAEVEPEEPEYEDPNEAARQELPAEAPLLYLTEWEVHIKAGESFERLSYVEDITDDKDPRDRLYRNISIEGNVDTNTPGTYELTYFCMDADGNRSNNAILTVVVEEAA